MKEYGNYYSREDIIMPSSSNWLGLAITKAKSVNDVHRKHRILRENVACLVSEAKSRNEMQMGIELISQYNYVFYIAFDYNGKVYYWWELFRNAHFENVREEMRKYEQIYRQNNEYDSLDFVWGMKKLYDDDGFIKSALEFPLYNSSFVTYVWFATDEKQTPLMCTPQFKNLIKKSF